MRKRCGLLLPLILALASLYQVAQFDVVSNYDVSWFEELPRSFAAAFNETAALVNDDDIDTDDAVPLDLSEELVVGDMDVEISTVMDTLDAATYLRSFQSLTRPLKFFHIPKTAGTAVEASASKHKIPWGSCDFYHKPARGDCPYPRHYEWPRYIGWWHLPSMLFPIAHLNPYEGAEIFGVVRCPYDRLVSEFYYICSLRPMPWRPNQCNRTRLFEHEYMNQWLTDKMKANSEAHSAVDYVRDNGHFTRQSEFVMGPHDVRMIDHVLRMDRNFTHDFERLMKAFSLDRVQLKKQNALGAKPRTESHLTVDDLDNATVSLIEQLYPHDFDFGYDRRSENQTTVR